MGMTYRATDIQTANIYLDLWVGYAEPAIVRGVDVVISGKPGRTEMPKVADLRELQLRGYVRGTGATAAARQQSWRTATDALMALMDYSLASGALAITAPYLGLSAGSKTIQARCVNAVGGEPLKMRFQLWTFGLVAIGDPPEWA